VFYAKLTACLVLLLCALVLPPLLTVGCLPVPKSDPLLDECETINARHAARLHEMYWQDKAPQAEIDLENARHRKEIAAAYAKRGRAAPLR
jgi:hypothetical protein